MLYGLEETKTYEDKQINREMNPKYFSQGLNTMT